MKSGQGFVLVYSVISPTSLKELDDIYQQIIRAKDTENFACVLVGNKCDLVDRKVTTEQGREVAKRFNNCPFVEASALSNYNVELAIDTVVREILKKNGDYTKDPKKRSTTGCAVL